MSDIKNKNSEEAYGYAIDMIQKLTTALYRVTDLFSDKEPLKWTLRESALSLHSKIMAINRRGPNNNIVSVLEEIQVIISSLKIASVGTFISSINFEILIKEYDGLYNFIENQKEVILPEDKLIIKSIGQDKGHPKMSFIKDNIKDRKVIAGNNNGNNGNNGNNERKEKIVNFLKENNNKNVSDIAGVLGGVSEKTIQRDLSELIKQGRVAGYGERRWRVYSINK